MELPVDRRVGAAAPACPGARTKPGPALVLWHHFGSFVVIGSGARALQSGTLAAVIRTAAEELR